MYITTLPMSCMWQEYTTNQYGSICQWMKHWQSCEGTVPQTWGHVMDCLVSSPNLSPWPHTPHSRHRDHISSSSQSIGSFGRRQQHETDMKLAPTTVCILSVFGIVLFQVHRKRVSKESNGSRLKLPSTRTTAFHFLQSATWVTCFAQVFAPKQSRTCASAGS